MVDKRSPERIEYQRQWWRNKYNTNPEFKERTRENARRYQREKFKDFYELIAKFRANGCKRCKEKSHDCLCAHHRNPAKKVFSISSLTTKGITLDDLVLELKKCTCLCLNCHAKLHAKKKRRELKNGS